MAESDTPHPAYSLQAYDPGGRPRLMAGDLCYHGPGEPEAQARRWIEEQVPPDALVVAVLGCGLGYHLQALRQMRPRTRAVVWEPWSRSEEVSRLLAERLPDDICVAGDAALFRELLGRLVVYDHPGAAIAMLIPPGIRKRSCRQTRQFLQAVRLVTIRRDSNQRTAIRRIDQWLGNFASNFRTVLQLPEAVAARQCLQRIPCVIIAAGPSLERTLDALRRCRERAVIISVGTIFKRLVAEGIRPDIVVILEGDDKSGQVAGEPALGQTLLALSSTGHPRHFTLRARRTLVFHSSGWLAGLAGSAAAIPDGGNVASCAFTLAVVWGCNPIILAGQDLSFSRTQAYAKGAASPVKHYRPEQLSAVAGNADETVLSSPEMVSYLAWYEESAAHLARVRPDLRLINATEGGARIVGFHSETLDGALRDRPRLSHTPQDLILAKLTNTGRDYARIRENLGRLRQQARTIIRLAEDPGTDPERLRERLREYPWSAALLPLLAPQPRQDPAQVRRTIRRLLKGLSAWAAQLQRQTASRTPVAP